MPSKTKGLAYPQNHRGFCKKILLLLGHLEQALCGFSKLSNADNSLFEMSL